MPNRQPPVKAPRYTPAERRLEQEHAGVTVIITQDAANVTRVELRLDLVNPPPVVVTMGSQELYSTAPDPDEWQARADELAPLQALADAREEMRTAAVIAVGPSTAVENIETVEAAVDAALDAALGASPTPPPAEA